MDVVQGHVSSVWWNKKQMCVKWTLVELSNFILRALFYASCQQFTFWRVLYVVQPHRYTFSTSASEMLVLFLNTRSKLINSFSCLVTKKIWGSFWSRIASQSVSLGVVFKSWSISDGTGLGTKHFIDILTNSRTNVPRSSEKRRKKGPLTLVRNTFEFGVRRSGFCPTSLSFSGPSPLRQNKHALSSSP